MDNSHITQMGQVKNLIMLALADGRVEESELALIAAVAARENLTEEQLNHLLEHPDLVSVELPGDEETKLRYLRDMVSLMIIDGDMDETELSMCKIYAIALGFQSTSVEQLVLDIVKQLKS